VRLEIVCPNVKRLDDSGSYQFLDVSFCCDFHGVSYQDLSRENEDGMGSFVGAEIDAETDLVKHASETLKVAHHSLLVEFENARCASYFATSPSQLRTGAVSTRCGRTRGLLSLWVSLGRGLAQGPTFADTAVRCLTGAWPIGCAFFVSRIRQVGD